MTVKGIFTEYTDLCEGTAFGRQITTMPEQAVEALNDIMDGVEVDMTGGGGSHPDNVWVNGISCLDDEDVLTATTNVLTYAEYAELKANDGLEQYIEDHKNEIEEELQEKGHLLAHTGTDSWWFLQ